MAQEPYTIILRSGQSLAGSSAIPLTRGNNDFRALSNSQRVYEASVTSGNQIRSELFGFFSAGAVVLLTIHASSSNPHDRVVQIVSTTARHEYSLTGVVQLVLTPNDTLEFHTSGATTIALVANALSDEQHAALKEKHDATRYRVRLTRSDGAGFSASGTAAPQLTWSSATRRFDASVGGGAITLASLVPGERRFEGVSVRARLSGFDADAGGVGVSSSANGEAFLYETPRGAWSRWLPMSHDDALALATVSPPVASPVIYADIEVDWSRALASECCEGVASSVTAGTSTPVGGVIPFAAWSDYSVNAAGARLSEEGWTLFTHAVTTNAAGGFVGGGQGNKVVFGTDFGLVDQPITALSSFAITYADRRPAETSILANPYVNFVVDINGDGSVYKIFVLDQHSNPALNLLDKASVGSVPADHEYTLTWIGGGRVKVVLEIAGVTPVVDEGAGWLNKVYKLADILAEYPNAKFAHAFPDDGGLPADVCLPATLLVVGDSNWTNYASVLVRRVTLNA